MGIDRPLSRVALVTGASHGIGRAVATALVRRHCSLVLSARSVPDLENVRAELLTNRPDAQVLAIPSDLSIQSQREKLVSSIHDEFGRLNLVVHCASARPDPDVDSTIVNTPVETIEQLIQTNVAGTIYLVKQLQPLMEVGRPSNFIFIASDWALRGTHGPPVFSAVKAAIGHFNHAIRKEMASYGISVTTIFPGDVASFDKDWKTPKWSLDDHLEAVLDELGDSRISLLDLAETVLFVADRKLARVEEIYLAPLNPEYDY